MFAKLLLFFTTLFSVFNPTNTRFCDSDIVKPSYNSYVNTGSYEYIVKVNLYDKDKTTFINTGSFTIKSEISTTSPIFVEKWVKPSIYTHFWWSMPCSNSNGINIANLKNYTYDRTIRTFNYNYYLTDINITGVCRFIKADTNEQVATETMEELLDYFDYFSFTSAAFIEFLDPNVFETRDTDYAYNFWLGGAYNSLSSSNNPNYQINSSGVTTCDILLYPKDYGIEDTKYLINAFYSNNGYNGLYTPLISYKSLEKYELNYTPTLAELFIQYKKQSTFNFSNYNLCNTSFVDNANHTATLYLFTTPIINNEVVDIWGLAFSMITLPFTFFSTAFNLTIFEGTPYAFNFSWFLISVLCVLVLITLIRLVLMFRK